MTRGKWSAWTFGVVGAVAAASVADRGAFVIAFFWLMFGGIAGLLVLLARRTEADIAPPEVAAPSPFTDQLGVHRYPGDVLDVENHPTPGANGRY
jgi:hypothetical protein